MPALADENDENKLDITVTVKLFAFFREAAKHSKIEFKLKEGTDIFQLLNVLCKSYNLKDQIFDEKYELKAWIKIMKNGRNIDFLDGLETKLDAGDEIAVFPPAAGGSDNL
ncbi:MAG: ubiquitin-like small modifier protein 1 [Candidatus Hodarchaeota archaeon]